MPYKSEKIPLGKYDRRVKLTDVQREEIKELRKLGLSYRVIGDRYGVSKSLIILVCIPILQSVSELRVWNAIERGDTHPPKKSGPPRFVNIENTNINYIRRVRYEGKRVN